MSHRPRIVEVHIDRLVVHGARTLNGVEIARRVEAELAQLLRENGVPAWFHESSSVEKMQAAMPRLSSRRSSEIGSGIAAAVHEGWSSRTSPSARTLAPGAARTADHGAGEAAE